MLWAARQYIGMAVPVFPVWPIRVDGTCACDGRFGFCAGPAKHPATRWRHGASDELPTRDLAQAERWWGTGSRFGLRCSAFGIGVPTGKMSGIYVVDIDNKSNKNGSATLAALVATHGPLPDGPRVFTPSGGLHYFFRDPGEAYGSSVEVSGVGIDTRGEGGCIIVAPSMHKSGKRYAFDQTALLSRYMPDNLPSVPAWFLARLEKTVHARAEYAASVYTGPQVPHAEAGATLAELLDSAYVRWLVDEPEKVPREPWRVLATNLHAACSGYEDLLKLAWGAWNEGRAAYKGYHPDKSKKVWVDAAKSPPTSFAHAMAHGAPAEVCSSAFKNLKLEARSRAGSSQRSPAFVEAALAYLAENPGQLGADARARGVTVRELLLAEGYLEDTSGYVNPSAGV